MQFFTQFVNNLLGRPDGNARERYGDPEPRRQRGLPDTSGKSQPAGPSGARPRRTGNGAIDRHQHVAQNSLELENEQLKLQIINLHREIEKGKDELSSAKQELESNRVFNNQADEVSETDIKDKLSALNDSVYQLASTIAEAWADSKLEVSPNSPGQNTALFFGESLYQLVMSYRQKDHSSFLVSLQACLSYFNFRIMSSAFSSIASPEKTEILQRMFDNINASQSTAVSARWRSLAHMHGQALLHDQQGLCRLLIERLTDLYSIPVQVFESKYGEDVSNLIDLALGLRKTIYGEYVSGDVEVLYFPPIATFDAKRMEVDNPRRAGTTAASGPILGTTTIGLARTLHHRKRQGGKWVYEDQYGTLVPAKILMSLDD